LRQRIIGSERLWRAKIGPAAPFPENNFLGFAIKQIVTAAAAKARTAI
jgi:hypothetical protein